MKKQEQLSFKVKPQQLSQHSFIKQYQTFLQKNRKTTPIRSPFPINSLSAQKNKTSPSRQIKPLFGHHSINDNRIKTSVSPPILCKERVHSLFECDSNPTKSSTSFEKSISGVSIFHDSTKQLEELHVVAQKERPDLQKGIQDILSLIKKEKQVILNDMKQLTKQMNKYKQQYDELQNEHNDLQQQRTQLQDSKDLNDHPKEQINETYAQMIGLLSGMGVDSKEVLPELGEQCDTQSQQQLDKDDVIILQKLIIKKLVKKIEDSRQLNQLLLTKLKEQ